MPFTTYILFNPVLDRYYIGSTGNLEDRFSRHNQGRSKATKAGAPHWQIVYTKDFPTRAQAVQWKLSIKMKKRRAFIETLIQNEE